MWSHEKFSSLYYILSCPRPNSRWHLKLWRAVRALCWARKVKLINCLSNNKSTTLTNNLFLTLHLISCMDFARCPLCPARSTYWVTWCFCVMSLKMSLAMSSKTQRGVNGTYPNLHGSWGRMSNPQVHFCYKDKMLPSGHQFSLLDLNGLGEQLIQQFQLTEHRAPQRRAD